MLIRYRALPVAERRDAWSALWRLLVVRFSLIGGVHRTRRWLGGSARLASSTLSLAEQTLWARRALALQRVGRRLPGVQCLARSLALRWWMRASAIDAMLIIAARKGPDGLDSHAWVEVGRTPVDECPETVDRYHVIWREDTGPDGNVHSTNRTGPNG